MSHNEIFEPLQKEYIINRTKEDLKDKIKTLIKRPQDLKKLSEENIEQIKDWSWKKQIMKFKEFFDGNLN